MEQSRRIAIVGAGPTGYTLAMTLSKKGYKVDIFERRDDPFNQKDVNEWRSLFLIVHSRLNKAWENIGVLEEMLSDAQPIRYMKMHLYDGSATKFSFSGPGEQVNSLRRDWIIEVLARKVKEHANVTVHYNTSVSNVDLKNGSFDVTYPDGKKENKPDYDWVFGADGTYSTILAAMKGTFDFSYSQEYCEYGFFEVPYKADDDGNIPLEKDCLHQFISNSAGNMCLTTVNKNGSCNIAVLQRAKGENGFDSFKGRMHEYGPWVRSLHPSLADRFFPDQERLEKQRMSRPVSSRAGPWSVGKFTIMGDAAHSMNPFGGLGMNFNIQECQFIDEFDTQYPGDWKTITEKLQEKMKPQVDAAVEYSTVGFYNRSQNFMSNTRTQKVMVLDSHLSKLYSDVFDSMMRRIFYFPDLPFQFASGTGMLSAMMLLELEKEIPDLYDLIKEGKRDERLIPILKKWQERQPGPGKPPMLPPGPNFGDPSVFYLQYLDTFVESPLKKE